MLCCMQGGQGPGGQQDLLAKLAQAAAAHPHLQRAVPSANARTLDDIEAAVRGSAPPGGLLGAFQQGAQGAKPGNALLSLLQGNAGPPNTHFGQVGDNLQRIGAVLCPLSFRLCVCAAKSSDWYSSMGVQVCHYYSGCVLAVSAFLNTF